MPDIANLNVSRETMTMLEEYTTDILKWTSKINLIARGQKDEVWERHIVDSAQLFTYGKDPVKRWVDLGSGGGLPGVVLAILSKGVRGSTEYTLVESDQRKAAFLRSCKSKFELNMTVISDRIEAIKPQNACVVSARALAPLPKLLNYVQPHLAVDGVAILPKGKNHKLELEEAAKEWNFSHSLMPSITSENAGILELRDIKRG